MIRRLRDEPVVHAGSVDRYGAIFNAGLLHHDGRYHLFARAVRDGYRRNDGPGPRFLDYVSDVLVFESIDGADYEFRYTLAEAGSFGVDCFEDPRTQLVRSGAETHVVMTYTNLPHASRQLPWRIGAHLLRYDAGRFVIDGQSGRLLGPEGIANKDAVVFNLADDRVALIHRVHPNIQVAVFDTFDALWDADASYWDRHLANLDEHTIIAPRPGALGVGAGAPPLATEAGLLLFFHERRADGAYTVRVALLDEHSGAVVRMLEDELLEPELAWEREGDVDNVVFVQGAHRRDDRSIYLTYGAADRHVGAAVVDEAALLESLLAGSRR
jgi:predicted GH43/DUF377 family glycosyl hydrolase